MDGWLSGWMDLGMYGIGAWVDGWLDGWMDVGMYGWLVGPPNTRRHNTIKVKKNVCAERSMV